MSTSLLDTWMIKLPALALPPQLELLPFMFSRQLCQKPPEEEQVKKKKPCLCVLLCVEC